MTEPTYKVTSPLTSRLLRRILLLAGGGRMVGVWPGAGQGGPALAEHFDGLLGRAAATDIDVNTQLGWDMVDGG